MLLRRPFLLLSICLPAFIAVKIYGSDLCRFVAVVDGMSSGRFLAKELKKQGYKVIHVKSSPGMSKPSLTATYHPEDYARRMIHKESIEDTVQRLEKLEPAAVIAGSESGVSVAEELAKKLGLPTNVPELRLARVNKASTAAVLEAKGLPVARHTVAKTYAEAEEFIDSLASTSKNWVVVVKPTNSAGTYGVTACRSKEAVKKAFENLIGKLEPYGREVKEVLVQEFLEGTEYAVNTVSVEGKHIITDIWQYSRTPVEGALNSYDYDYLLPFAKDNLQNSLRKEAAAVLDAVGLLFGPGHLEFIYVPGRGPILVDIGARMCGAGLPELVHLATGQSQINKTVQAYLKPKEFLADVQGYSYTLQKHSMIVFLRAKNEGSIFSVEGIESWTSLPAVIQGEDSTPYITFAYKPGQKMKRTIDSDTTVGTVRLLADSREELDAAYQAIRQWEKDRGF